jgi:glutathione S-transferase
MKLFYSPGACSLSPHIVLQEAGIPFSLVKVDLATKKTPDGVDFTTINSKGGVPALQLDDGRVLTEGPAIVQYLGDLKPEAGLVPRAGTFERYQLMEMLNYLTSEIHKPLGSLFNPRMSAETREATLTLLAKKFDWLSKQLTGKTCLIGTSFSVADAYLFTLLGWTKPTKVDLSKWPVLAAYHATIAQRPKVQEAMRAEGLLK